MYIIGSRFVYSYIRLYEYSFVYSYHIKLYRVLSEVKCKSSQVRSMDSAKKIKMYKSNTTQEHTYKYR